MSLVCIGLCTARRPIMLRECLDSLAALRLPVGYQVCLIVSDNEELPANKQAVLRFAESCPFAVHYVHEPRRGIPFARNAVLDKAMSLGAGWIAFIDDDEIADQNWLAALMSSEYINVPILSGAHYFQYPEPLPFWAIPTKEKKHNPKREYSAPTNNVRISAELLKSGLRFNEKLKLANGEDTEFLDAARKLGFKTHRIFDAITIEKAHRDRLTYRYQVYRMYCSGATNMRIAIKRDGLVRAILWKSPLIPAWVISGVFEVLISPFFILGGLSHFKYRALVGGKKVAKAIGRVAALAGHIP